MVKNCNGLPWKKSRADSSAWAIGENENPNRVAPAATARPCPAQRVATRAVRASFDIRRFPKRRRAPYPLGIGFTRLTRLLCSRGFAALITDNRFAAIGANILASHVVNDLGVFLRPRAMA